MVGVLAAVRQELQAMAVAGETLSAELAGAADLFGRYNPRLRDLHDAQAAALDRIIDRIGWPTAELVGAEAAEAAWWIAQQAITRPPFQRQCLILLQEASALSAVPAWQPAVLLDRIRVLEGRQQVYGTQIDWDPDGGLSPCPIEDPEWAKAGAPRWVSSPSRCAAPAAPGKPRPRRPPARGLGRARARHGPVRTGGRLALDHDRTRGRSSLFPP